MATEQDTGASAEADRAATAAQPSPAVSGKAGIPCAEWSARIEHRNHICVMLGDAKHSYLHRRDWDGRIGWQYTRFGYSSRRTRKLRETPEGAMLAAPGLSTESKKAAAMAVAALFVEGFSA